MQKRKFDELVSYFNKKVSEMEIETKYKMELLGMVTALGCAHEKEMSDLSETKRDSSDTISRQAAIDAVDSETVSTNPEHFKSSEKFIKFMGDADIASFGEWQWANGFNTAVVASKIQLQKLPSAEPVRMKGRWETDSYGAMDDGEYLVTRCSVCGTAYEYGHDDRYCGFCGTEMSEGDE